jgi:hypothetical protein
MSAKDGENQNDNSVTLEIKDKVEMECLYYNINNNALQNVYTQRS